MSEKQEKTPWELYGLSEKKIESLKKKIESAGRVWLFCKGNSFNSNFDWSLVEKNDFIIALDDVCMHVKNPDLIITFNSEIRDFLKKSKYKTKLVAALDPEWKKPDTEYDAVMVAIGALGIKYVVTVGFDAHNTKGLDYKFADNRTPKKISKGRAVFQATAYQMGVKMKPYDQALMTYKR